MFLIPSLAGLLKNPEKMFVTKPCITKSPDLSKMKEVIIDHRTKIYIAPDADVEEAINRYKFRNAAKRVR